MEPIMIFHITIDGKGVSALQAKTGGAVIIPFTANIFLLKPLYMGAVWQFLILAATGCAIVIISAMLLKKKQEENANN